MQVFKAFFKVIKKNMSQMLIYFGIFMVLSLVFLNAGVGEQLVEFEETKPNIAIFDGDGSEFSNKLKEYLALHSTIVDLENDDDKIRDALFFREISYVLYIPANYGNDFFSGGIALERFMILDSFSTAYMDQIVAKYLNTYEAYKEFMPRLTVSQIADKTLNVLETTSQVNLVSFGEVETLSDNSMYYFNYFAYSMLAIILLGVGAFMITFKQIDLRRRNLCSPISNFSMNMQLIFGNFLFAFIVWAIMFVISFFLFTFDVLAPKALHYGVNTFSYMLVCLALSFFVAILINSKNAQAAVVNVLSLGLSFISGVFVPQFLLGDFVLRIASFAPTYWFVKANLKINVATDISNTGLELISTEVFIQLGFAAALILASILVIRYKRTSTT